MLSNSPMRLSRSWLAILFIFSVLSVGSCFNVFAASTINVQGKLTNKEGNPITGIQDLYFRLYNVSIAAVPLWTEQHSYNLGNDGLFNVRLGETASLDTLSFDKQLYLGISVNGEDEMLPRQVLTASPYALGSIGDFSVGKKLFVNGNVGIGTAGPNRKFEIANDNLNTPFSIGENLFLDGNGGTVRITNNAYMSGGAWTIKDATARASTIEIRDTGIVDIYGTLTAGAIDWRQMVGIDAPNNKVYFPSGNVGIGTASPATKLHISAGDNSLSLFGPNSSWGGYLLVGAGRNDITTGRAQVISTNGNLHLDSASNCDTYINYYSGRNTYINTLGGNVGIGTAGPGAKLDVMAAARTGIYHPTGKVLYVTGDFGTGQTGDGGIEFRHSNATQGIGFGYNTIYQTGINANQDLNIRAIGTGPITLNAVGGATGNVGIGTASPATKLHISAGDNSLSLFGPNSSWGGYLLVGAGRNDITTGRAQVISTNGNLHLDSASNCDTYINYYSGRNTYINTLGGNVGIGTASPGAKLDVAGDVNIRGNRINLGTDGTQHAWIKVEGTHALGFRFSDRRVVVTDGWSKNFMISHPLDPQHKYLLHSTLEGPENGVYYRGEAQLINGKTVVQLPSYFEALTRKEGRTVLLTSKFESDEHISMLAASEIKDGRFGVRMIDEKNTSQKFYWEVKAIRADLTPLEVEIAKDE